MRQIAALLLALPLLAGADTTLRFCAAGSPKTCDPSMTDSGIDHVAHLPIFGTLVETKRGGDQFIPGLAASWTISPDGLAYTFDLRRGVAWQSSDEFRPTREFNADDVLFTFGRLLNRDSAFAKALPGVSPYVASFGWEKLVQKVEKLGSHQVRITLAERDASFLHALTLAFAAIQSSELMAQMIQADWAKVGVTARIVTYEWGEYLRRIDAGEHDAALAGWNGDPEPAGTAGQLACGAASGTFWCNPAYDKLLAEARQVLKQDERKALYAKAQRLAMEQLPWSPIAYGRPAVPERASVKGFILELDGSMYFDGALPR